MAICKNCIHFDVCSPYTAPNESFPEVEDGCRCFKDKAKFIESPCNVGDKVYVDGISWSGYACIHYENQYIHSKFFVLGEIVSIVKTKKQLLMKIRVASSDHRRYYHKRYTVNAIGKTVFLSREEAEKALKGGAEKCR